MNKGEIMSKMIQEIERKKEDILEKEMEVMTLQHANAVLLEQTHIQRVRGLKN